MYQKRAIRARVATPPPIRIEKARDRERERKPFIRTAHVRAVFTIGGEAFRGALVCQVRAWNIFE